MAYVYMFNPCDLSEEHIEQLTQEGVNVEHWEEHDLYQVYFHCDILAEQTLKSYGLSEAYFDSWYED